jgi:two-component system, chemotaxis family, sensor kinase CheA
MSHPMNDKELMKKLKGVFIQEARERLASMSSNLISLEQEEPSSPEQTSVLEDVYRDAHSLKGASRSVGLNSIESVFQVVEDIFNEIKEGQSDLAPELFDILQDFIKTLNRVINSSEMESPDNIKLLKEAEEIFVHYLKNKDGQASIENKGVRNASKESDATILENAELNTLQKPVEFVEPVEPMEPVEPVEPKLGKPASLGKAVTTVSSAQDTVRISSGKLDSLLLKSENMIRIKQMFYEHIPFVYESLNLIYDYKQTFGGISSDYFAIKQDLVNTEGKSRIKNQKSLEKIIGFIENNSSTMKSLEAELKKLLNIEKENHRNTEKIVDGFLYDVKEIAMLPFSNILCAFPIMVRDISKKLEKNIVFTMKGEEIKLDRRILQEIKDPLIHIIRNSIDHGIEDLSDRKKCDKREKGSVELNISQKEGNKIYVTIRDDGKGLDAAKIKKRIVDNNLFSSSEADLLTESQILEYIFHSGFSTKEIITDLSGRGLGLAIVKDKIENLGGKVLIDSKPGEYSEVQMILPVTLATFKGVLVETDKRTYVIPSNNLQEAIRVKSDCVRTVENKRTICHNKSTYPLVKLTSVLGVNGTDVKKDEEYITAVIISKSNELMALEIDEIIEEQEILIKDLGSQLKKVNNLVGATILNSGEIVPILNVSDLFKSATNLSDVSPGTERTVGPNSKKIVTAGKKTILVVEDSITSRILLKNILESAGYITETAVDGMDGLTTLKSKNIDLVVSDIEMPRMDGFTLTLQIRAETKLKNLPVILVTSRSAQADKERGAEVGADAYIIKSEFDQTSLLGTIKTLL